MVLKILQNLQKNTYDRVSILIKLMASTCNFIKKETGTGVFQWILGNFQEHLFTENIQWVFLGIKKELLCKFHLHQLMITIRANKSLALTFNQLHKLLKLYTIFVVHVFQETKLIKSTCLLLEKKVISEI